MNQSELEVSLPSLSMRCMLVRCLLSKGVLLDDMESLRLSEKDAQFMSVCHTPILCLSG